MSIENPMSSEVLISSNNAQLKVEKVKRNRAPKIPRYQQYCNPQKKNMQLYIDRI